VTFVHLNDVHKGLCEMSLFGVHRVMDTAGNVTALPLSNNRNTLDTGNPLVTLSTTTDTKNTGNVSVKSSETGTAYLVHSSVVVNVGTTQAMLDTIVTSGLPVSKV
jgi:hypothetical protein